MSKLHLRFRNIRPDVLDAARQLFDRNPHQLDIEEQGAVASDFIAKVCEAYSVPTPEVRVEGRGSRWQGTYEYLPAEAAVDDEGNPQSIQAAQVILRKFSVLNIFGIVRTHLLNHQAVTPKADEPWGWACSLFYAVKPVRFRKLVREGKIRKGLTPADTYSRATFARMVAAGVAEEDGNVLVKAFDPRLLNDIEGGTLDVRTLLPRGSNPSALSSWSWDEDDDDEIDILAEDDHADAPASDPDPFDDDNDGDDVDVLAPTEDPEDEIDFAADNGEDADPADIGEELARAAFAAEIPLVREAEASVALDGDTQTWTDGLDDLGIVALRGLIRGRVPGGYSLSKPDLIAALRAQGIDSTGTARV